MINSFKKLDFPICKFFLYPATQFLCGKPFSLKDFVNLKNHFRFKWFIKIYSILSSQFTALSLVNVVMFNIEYSQLIMNFYVSVAACLPLPLFWL